MAIHSEEADVIKSKPIGDGLAAFCDTFHSTCAELGIPTSGEAVQLFMDKDAKNLALELILTLSNLPTARLLSSPNGRGNLRSDLIKFALLVDSDDFDLMSLTNLLKEVVGNAGDLILWNTVKNLIIQSTPPPRLLSNIDQTPWLQTTGSVINSSKQRKFMDDILKGKLHSLLFIDVPGFYNAFFKDVVGLESAATSIFMKLQEGNNPSYDKECGWSNWPEGAKEKDVLQWLTEKIETFLNFTKAVESGPSIPRRSLAQPNRPVSGSTAERKLDVGFINISKAAMDLKCHWSQILVPGELKSNADRDKSPITWYDLARYVREILAAQETRRFVLGFTLCGSIMRLWEFDRLGGIASSPFDINKDGLLFISVILGYLLMNEEQLGFDPTIITLDGKQYIDIIRHNKKERLILTELLKRAPCIAGRATTCWKAYCEADQSKRPLVIKDSWQYPERDDEGERLQEATKKGVVNVARYYHHETVSIGNEIDGIYNNVRKGLDITKASNFRRDSTNISSKRLSWSSSSAIAGKKRKHSNSLSDDNASPAIMDRLHRRIVICDYGKPLYKASSRVAMLAALEGHESLRNLTNTIQGDVSIGNLMMNEEEGNPSWSSFLIDLDLSIDDEREESSGARAKTGTRAFMAIGVLLDERHTFKHDLESFFWVLFWICIHYHGPNKRGSRVVQKFEKWNYMNMDDLGELKKGTIGDEEDFLSNAEENFTPYYQPLVPWVNRLRKVLFPDGQRRKKEDLKLYTQMQEVLQEAQKDPNIAEELE